MAGLGFARLLASGVYSWGVGVSVEVDYMGVADDQLLDLVATVYEAALEPSLWPQVAAGTAKAFHAPHARLGVVDRRRGSQIVDAPSQNLSEPQLSMVRYQTPRSNPGLAFSALTTPMPPWN